MNKFNIPGEMATKKGQIFLRKLVTHVRKTKRCFYITKQLVYEITNSFYKLCQAVYKPKLIVIMNLT